MYTDGSSALKTEYYEYPSVGKKAEEGVKGRNKASGVNVRLLKKRVVALVLLAFTMAFVVTLRYALIAKEFGKLSETKDQLELISAKVVETQMKAEGNLDPKKVEQEAQRLGFSHPAKDQIKYISLGNTDNGEVLKTEKPSGLSAFINRASVILEYLH
jgi:hypothetical protein